MEAGNVRKILVKINSEQWSQQSVQIQGEEIIFSHRESCAEAFRLNSGCIVQVEKGKSDLQLAILAYPRLGKRRRKVQIAVEGETNGDIDELFTFIQRICGLPANRKKLLAFVNPFAGTKSAESRWATVCRILEARGVEYETVRTERAGHALKMIQTVDPSQYSGVVTVSGDGLVHEVINGMAKRTDSKQFMRDFPIGIIPGGSGNAISCSLLYQHHEAFQDEVIVSALNVAVGKTAPVDYIEVETDRERLVSMFGVAWGLVPECDIGSEVIRWAGYFRSYLWAAYRIIHPRVYNGRVYYLPAESQEECSRLPAISEPVPASWSCLEGGFLNAYASKQSWLDYSLIIAPQCKYNDGMIHLCVVRAKGRREMITWLVNTSSGAFLESVVVHQLRVKAFRFEVEGELEPMTVDAEKLECRVVQGRIVPRGCCLLLKELTVNPPGQEFKPNDHAVEQ